jgi:hypothetical protein
MCNPNMPPHITHLHIINIQAMLQHVKMSTRDHSLLLTTLTLPPAVRCAGCRAAARCSLIKFACDALAVIWAHQHLQDAVLRGTLSGLLLLVRR